MAAMARWWAAVGLVLLAIVCSTAQADTSLGCTLCGVVFNELEGMLAENLTESAIESALKSDVCARLPSAAGSVCSFLVSTFLPTMIASLESKETPGAACVALKMCTIDPAPHADPLPVRTFEISLDDPPLSRFSAVCSDPIFNPLLKKTAAWFSSWIPADALARINRIGEEISQYFPAPFADEILSCAEAAGMPAGELVLLNLGYEISDACTSIIGQTAAGENFHARNLDFGFLASADLLRNLSLRLDFTSGGQVVFSAGSFAGFVGVLSAVRPGAFSLTLNTRLMPRPIIQLLDVYLASLEEHGYSLVSFLSRTVAENTNNYSAALQQLKTTELIADVYYILADAASKGDGCVIARNQTEAVNITCLSTTRNWFVLQTNYNWWLPPPWYDNRYVPATRGMQAMGQAGLSFSGLMTVLSTRPVFNQMTAHTALMLASNGTITVLQRWCNQPCPF